MLTVPIKWGPEGPPLVDVNDYAFGAAGASDSNIMLTIP